MNIENNKFFVELLEWLNKTMTIELFIKIAVLYFLIVWICIIVWVIKDSSDRSNSFFFQFFSLLLVTIWTPFWLLIYLLLRPTKTFFEKYNDDVEFNLVELNKLVDKTKKYKIEETENKKKELLLKSKEKFENTKIEKKKTTKKQKKKIKRLK